jgi:Xaa-Pro aminopeptidase
MKIQYNIPSLSEKEVRFNSLRKEMAKNNLYALIIGGKGHWWTGRGYFRYLTDFHLWGHDGLIYFPIEGEPYLVLSSDAVAKKIRLRGWVSNCEGSLDIGEKILKYIDKKKIRDKKIGIVGEENIISYRDLHTIKENLNIETVSATEIFDKVKMVKTEWEVSEIYKLWELAKYTLNQFQDNILDYYKKNKSQIELSSDITKILWESGIRDLLIFYGDDIDNYSHPTNEKINIKNKIRYHLEICGPSGHWLEITKNLAFKKIHDVEQKIMNDELLVFDEMLKFIKPSVTLKQSGVFYEKVLSEFGYEMHKQNSFDFHGQGLDTIEKPFYNSIIFNDSENWGLKENVAISYHPKRLSLKKGIWSTGINEDILVKQNGSVKFSKDWPHNWVQI